MFRPVKPRPLQGWDIRGLSVRSTVTFRSIRTVYDLQRGCKSGTITAMNTTIKIRDDTRKKLRLLAALLDKSMIDVIDGLVDEALKKVQAGDGKKGVQVSDISKPGAA
jgi:hypothetical protein